MSAKQTTSYCNICERPSLYSKQKINHLLHFFLTLFTLGLWAIVWIVLAIQNSNKPSRCMTCGTPMGRLNVPSVEAAAAGNHVQQIP